MCQAGSLHRVHKILPYQAHVLEEEEEQIRRRKERLKRDEEIAVCLIRSTSKQSKTKDLYLNKTQVTSMDADAGVSCLRA